ncbi:hypothetical protein K503DRAFT_54649 [Rhizopogon vinicolor AM-OR11-026]|uniref:TPR-like protein n=1 Tax=Rhizopogon vinicolor AM-OR11-026 TaxID=1314800 RepID=A0A1B7MGL1_9AGAM|nr:hypothetical protein K503DRAFT_54649 [Rhizopogon vinicolor AM-OR11-026]
MQMYALNNHAALSDLTFSPSSTPFPRPRYNPWAFLQASRAFGGGDGGTGRVGRHPRFDSTATTSIQSSPSHQPVTLPLPFPTGGGRGSVKRRQASSDLRVQRESVKRKIKPPPRVESTQPRDTSPEPYSSGEGTATGEEQFEVTEEGNWVNGTMAPDHDEDRMGAEWVDEDDKDDLIEEQLALRMQMYTLNNHAVLSDSTFSLSSTPFPGPGYNPWTFLQASRAFGGRGGTGGVGARPRFDSTATMSIQSSPSHQPLTLPIPFPSGRGRGSVKRKIKPSPRVESTQPRDTSPEPYSSGEETDASINPTVRNTCIIEHLPTAEEPLTQEIDTDGNNYNFFANRSFVFSRKGDWDHALNDAIRSVHIQPSLIGYISKSIALCGKMLIQDAMKTMDLAFMFADGDLKTVHLLLLVKAR